MSCVYLVTRIRGIPVNYCKERLFDASFEQISNIISVLNMFKKLGIPFETRYCPAMD